MKLDFGSGHNPKVCYKTCDITPGYNIDYMFDVNRYMIIGADDNTFDEIHCRNVLHHIKDLDRLVIEFNRVLKPTGIIKVIEPNKDSYKANYCLDYIWYRFINPRYDIWQSNDYRDYIEIFLKFFKLLNQSLIQEKEIILFKK